MDTGSVATTSIRSFPSSRYIFLVTILTLSAVGAFLSFALHHRCVNKFYMSGRFLEYEFLSSYRISYQISKHEFVIFEWINNLFN
ncbi:MAG: hypothetical protein ACREBS_02160 [Nitrososphaerales archaeon]